MIKVFDFYETIKDECVLYCLIKNLCQLEKCGRFEENWGKNARLVGRFSQLNSE